MRNVFLSSVLAAFLLFMVASCYSQNLDLIVTTQGDSIACRIDSITESHLYFEMNNLNKWIHTNIEKEKVAEYKQNEIDKRLYNFKPGTSIITSLKPEYPTSIRDIQKNSVYVGIGTLMYSRLMPLDQFGITLGVGIFNFDGWGTLAECTVLKGGVKHFFEPGIMGFLVFSPNSQDSEDPSAGGATIRLGYRYQGPGGLLLRAAPNLIFTDGDFYIFPALSVGYSF